MAKEKQKVFVWSQLGGPLAYQYMDGDGNIRRVTINPGPNEVEKFAFDQIKGRKNFDYHASCGYLRAGGSPKEIPDRLWRELGREPSDDLIQHLSKRAVEVPQDREPIGADKATSRDGARREVEDQLQQIKRRYGYA